MNRKQIERASEILKRIKEVEEMMNGCDNFEEILQSVLQMGEKPRNGYMHDGIRQHRSEMKPIFTAYIDKLKAELKELGYEDD